IPAGDQRRHAFQFATATVGRGHKLRSRFKLGFHAGFIQMLVRKWRFVVGALARLYWLLFCLRTGFLFVLITLILILLNVALFLRRLFTALLMIVIRTHRRSF